MCGGSFLMKYFITLEIEVRWIMRILCDLAAKQKSHHLSPHLAGAVDNGDVKLYPSLSQTGSYVFCVECNKQKLGWWPNAARLLDNVNYTAAFLVASNSFSLTFQSPLQHNVIWGLLLSYQCKFFCKESDNYSTFSLPLFLFFPKWINCRAGCRH